MTDQRIIDAVRNENYALKIYNASNNNNEAIPISTELIKTISAIYRFIEPSHLNGNLIVYKRFGDNPLLPRESASMIYNMDDLTHINAENIIIESSNELLYLWVDVKDITFLENTDDTVFYFYENNNECFYVNKQKINIPHYFECSSIYALHYFYLNAALKQYKNEKISASSCDTFKKCWYDSNRIFFKGAPEKQMQLSLKEFLSSALRGVEVVREYNLGASKPVDIRVKWTEANKAALIELKWIGKSISASNNITPYTDNKANKGAIQLKEYLDMGNTDTPNIISKAYLVVIDGRRSSTNSISQVSINSSDGLFYENVEIQFEDANKFFERMKNFEVPIRMFARPIYS